MQKEDVFFQFLKPIPHQSFLKSIPHQRDPQPSQNMSKNLEKRAKYQRKSSSIRTRKTKVEIIAQNHERDVDRKDAILQMLDRDIDEAEEQHQVAVRTHLLNVGIIVDQCFQYL